MITLQKSLTDSKELYLDQYKLLSKLTVVIPSYGRHPYLLRQAAYWRQSGVTVIALDGSIKPLSIDQQKIINAEKNFSYIHMPNGICERLNYAAKLIITPYAVLLGDDDFLLKGGCVLLSLGWSWTQTTWRALAKR